MSRLPGLLAEIELITDTETATRLALRAGGTEMKFSAHPDSALAQIVGAAAAAIIAAKMGPQKFTIPMAHLRGARGRRIAIARMLDADVSATEAAKACDVHERTARRVREKMKKRDPDLFDRD